jgi:pseudomonalisin
VDGDITLSTVAFTPPTVIASTTVAIPPNCSSLVVGSTQSSLSGSTVRLVQQSDGNLVVYRGSTPLWSSRTSGHSGARTVLQGDGNLVIYSPAGAALWSSRTNGHPIAYLAVQGNGNVVVYSGGTVSKALWSTNTHA